MKAVDDRLAGPRLEVLVVLEFMGDPLETPTKQTAGEVGGDHLPITTTIQVMIGRRGRPHPMRMIRPAVVPLVRMWFYRQVGPCS